MLDKYEWFISLDYTFVSFIIQSCDLEIDNQTKYLHIQERAIYIVYA